MIYPCFSFPIPDLCITIRAQALGSDVEQGISPISAAQAASLFRAGFPDVHDPRVSLWADLRRPYSIKPTRGAPNREGRSA
jgi:hypothetical protein